MASWLPSVTREASTPRPKKDNLRLRLAACLGIILLAALGNSVYALFTARHIRSELAGNVFSNAASLDDARQIMVSIANMRSAMRGIGLFAAMHNPEQVAKARGGFDAANDGARKAVDTMEARNLTPENRATVNEIRSRLAQWKDNFQEFVDLNLAGHVDQATELGLKRMTPAIDWLQKAASDLGGLSREREQTGDQAIDASMTHTELLNRALLILVLAAGVAAWFAIARVLRRV
ncbi:MAG: Tar ligand binding domain-containing protein, partial [Bryobacteraceae bacterium]